MTLDKPVQERTEMEERRRYSAEDYNNNNGQETPSALDELQNRV